jgi:TetR/AcrR family transcriptional regulator, transcriptional repressor for nem operon
VKVKREQVMAHREQILDVASTLLRERGYNGMGIHPIMKKVGLTHGGFYGHFASKDDLSAQITARVLGKNGWPKTLKSGNPNPSFSEAVHAYLSPRHRDDPGHGCLLAAVGADVGRQTQNVRRAFTEGFSARVNMLRTLAPGRSAAARRKKALATMAGLVGALILSRAVDDPKLSEEILDAMAATTLGRS